MNRILLAALLIALPAGAPQAEAPTAKVLRVVPSADLTQLDPRFASIVIADRIAIARNCYQAAIALRRSAISGDARVAEFQSTTGSSSRLRP